MESDVSETATLSDSESKSDMNNSEENEVEEVTTVSPVEICQKAKCSQSENEDTKNMTLAEKETLGLNSVSESLENDNKLENKDHIKFSKFREKKRVVVFLKKSVLKKTQNNGTQASNEWSVDVKRSNAGHSPPDHRIDDSSDIDTNDMPQLSTSVEECLQISKTSTSDEATKAKLSHPSSPKLLVKENAESSSLSSSATTSAPSSPQNEFETSTVSNITEIQKRDLKDDHTEQKKPVELTKSMISLLKFTLNFDHFPTSLSMITLAKMMNLAWIQVKDWFKKERLMKRENGFHLHNKVLKYCPYCDNNCHFINKELGQLHLYEEDHVKKVLQTDPDTLPIKLMSCSSSVNKEIQTQAHHNSSAKTGNESSKDKVRPTVDNALKKALGFTSDGNEPGNDKASTTVDNAVMKALGFSSVENELGKVKNNTNMDNAIMKAFGFSSVNEIPSTSQENGISPGISHAIALPDSSLLDSFLNNIVQEKSKSPKKASVQRKKKRHVEMPTSEECQLLLKPLQQGWTREVVYRATVLETGRKTWDVYYRPPVGKKLRSNVEIGKYLEQKGVQDLTEDNFDFSYKCLGENISNEIIRHATATPKPFANAKNKCLGESISNEIIRHATATPKSIPKAKKKQDEQSGLLSTLPKSMENKNTSVPAKQILTQEIPSFNWLEQKIQNGKVKAYYKNIPIVASIPLYTTNTSNHVNECNTSNEVPTEYPASNLMYQLGISTNTQKFVPSFGESLEKNGKENTKEKQRHLSDISPSMGVHTHLQTAVPIVRPSRVTALPKRLILPSSSNFQQHPPPFSNMVPFVELSSQASTTAAVLSSNNIGIENEMGQMTGFDTWHTPSWDKQNDEEQMSPSEINQTSKISPDITQESNESDNTPSSVSDTHTQVSLKNTSSDRPKIRIKSIFDLQAHPEKPSDADNKPFSLNTLASMFKFDDKNNMLAVSGIQTITTKENLGDMENITVTTDLNSPQILESNGCTSISPIKANSESINNENESSSKTCSHLNLEDIQFEEEVINDSATGSTNVTAIHRSESSSDSCNLNQSLSLSIVDNTHKKINVVKKRKQSGGDDDLPANKKVKNTVNSQSLMDDNSNLPPEIDIDESHNYTKNIDTDSNKTINENCEIAESPTIDAVNDLTDNIEMLSNNNNVIRNNNDDIVELSDSENEDGDNVEMFINNDIVIINNNDDIVELSDIDNENDSEHTWSDPLSICNPPKSVSPPTRLPPLHL